MRNAGGYAKIHPRSETVAVPHAAELLGVPEDKLAKAMVHGSLSRLTVAKASGYKRALTETLYSSLFDWLVRRINEQRPPSGHGKHSTSPLALRFDS